MLQKIEEKLPVFDTAEFKELVDKMEDTPFKRNILFFIENGYVVICNSVSAERIDKAVDAFVSWKKRNGSKFVNEFYKVNTVGLLDRIINIQANIPIFKELFAYSSSLEYQDFLFQRKTSFYTSLFFEVGSSQDIHRDEPYFWTQPAHYYFGTWLALEDTNETNGPLTVIPGSHKLSPALIDKIKIAKDKYPDLDNINPMDNDLWVNYQTELFKVCKEHNLTVKEVHAKKGDTIIWHPLLAHGGARIKDPAKTRMSLVIHTTPYDVPVFGQDVFYNPDKEVKLSSGFTYETINNRDIPQYATISIGHKDNFDYTSLI